MPMNNTVRVTIDRTGDYTSIDAAVAAAPPGTQIVIAPGTYRETVVLDKAVELIADGPIGSVVIAGQGAPGLWSTAPGGAVRGCTIRSELPSGGGVGGFLKRLTSSAPTTRIGAPPSNAAVVITSGQALFDACVVDGSIDMGIAIGGNTTTPTLQGIVVTGATNQGIIIVDGASPTISGCDIHHNPQPGISIVGPDSSPIVTACRFHDGGGNAIGIAEGATPTIEANRIEPHPFPAIHVTGVGTAPVIRGNVFDGGSDNAITIMDGASGLIEDNEMSGHREEIAVGDAGTHPVIRGNRLHDGQASGILVTSAANAELADNQIDRMAKSGIDVGGSGSTAVIRRNRISDGRGPGIVIFDGADATIEANTITGNLMSAILAGGAATTARLSGNTLRDNGGIAAVVADPAVDLSFDGDIVFGGVALAALDGTAPPSVGIRMAPDEHSTGERASPERPRVADRCGVGRMPLDVVADDSEVWVANGGDECLSRLDPRTGRTVQNVSLAYLARTPGDDIGPTALALDRTIIWVAALEASEKRSTGHLVAVDRNAGEVVWTLALGEMPMALAVAFGSVWAIDSASGTVIRVDPIGRRVVATIRVGKEPVALASLGNALFVGSRNDGTLTRVDPNSNKVSWSAKIGHPARLAPVDDALWVASPERDIKDWTNGRNELLRVDPGNGAVLDRFPTGGAIGAMTAGPNGLWIAPVGRICRVDTSTGAIVDSLESPSIAWEMASSSDSVWALYQHSADYRSTERMPGTLVRVEV